MPLTCSHQTLLPCSSNPHHTCVPKSSPFPTTLLLKLLPPTFFRNGSNSVSRRNRRFQVHANSSDSNELGTRPKVASLSNPSSSTSLLSFLCPLLKLFSTNDEGKVLCGRRSLSRTELYLGDNRVATSSLSTLARFPWGSRSKISDCQDVTTLDPPMHLQLFEFEACPFCRRVREAMTELDLSAEVYPCPKGSIRHRELVNRSGGKEQFPFLIDPNTGLSMYESGEIVRYLFQQYGKGRKPSPGLLESTLLTGWMPTILRAGRGMTLWERATVEPPPDKLELYSYENNPYARIVREALCELELPYILQNVGEGSLRSKLLVDASGSNEVPFLIDPNTGTHVGDYKKILSYLFQTYSVAAV